VVRIDHARNVRGAGARTRMRSPPPAELREDVLHVAGDGVLADHERRGDLAVALAGGHEPQGLELASGEPVRLTTCVASEERHDTRKIGDGAEAREHRA